MRGGGGGGLEWSLFTSQGALITMAADSAFRRRARHAQLGNAASQHTHTQRSLHCLLLPATVRYTEEKRAGPEWLHRVYSGSVGRSTRPTVNT